MTIKRSKGFTLIELMIVVAIIGILAAIAIPQFAQLISKSQEGQTKANLGTIRSALSIYYGDTEGYYPVDALSLSSLTTSSKYLQTVPNASLPKTTNSIGHIATSAVTQVLIAGGEAGWYYNNLQAGTNWGQVLVNCSHTDTKGQPWTSY